VILAYEPAYIFGENIRGVKPLLAIGGTAIAGIVAVNIYYRAGEDSGPLWPVFLGATAFLYLRWLVIHIFDLVFIWHLYIRKSGVMTDLKIIRRRNDEPNEQSQRLLDSRRLPVSG